MSLAYRLMYRLGFHPWDRMLPKELADVVTALPPGRALDLGSGLGTKAVFMATHGWNVTGVEYVPRALEEARRRASRAGVKVDFRRGDVTRLGDLKLEPGYNLVFDFGCFHGLKSQQRDAYVQGVNELAASGATLLMMAFTKPVAPITSGVSEAEMLERFGPEWTKAWSHVAEVENGSAATRRGMPGWYCFIRK
jgi:cyclopropane fatty-acyl-phospholipid synthase-like methyltransferase